MYCRFCNRKGAFGAKRCAQCGRPLSRGSSPYDTGDDAKTKMIVLGVIGGVVALALVLLMLLPMIGGGRPDSGDVSIRNGDREETGRRGRGNRDDEEVIEVLQTEPEEKEEIQLPTLPKPTKPVETEPEETEPAQPTQPKNAEPEYVEIPEFTITSYKELKDKLAPECLDKPIKATFTYLGGEGDLSFHDVCDILSARAAGVSKLDSGKYRITALPYAGARILKAYNSGDTSTLTADELAAMKKAEEIVDMARKTANSDWELELILHDWMCENISYYDVDFSIEFTEKRPLNAIGALLDGKANCQGYTDCFFLLGRMAGFVVDKQSDPEVTVHAFNTIKLGGQWYIVDVTHDDLDDERGGQELCTYRYLNAGLADCDERTWKDYCERNPVAPVSGTYHYYTDVDLGEEHNYQKTFYNLYDAGRNIINEYLENGRNVQNVIVRGVTADHNALFNALDQETNRLGISYEGTVWYWNTRDGSTVYTVYLN